MHQNEQCYEAVIQIENALRLEKRGSGSEREISEKARGGKEENKSEGDRTG